MKLLKLTYIAHGYYLGFFNKPLIQNRVQAWKYGPVIPELYGVIKRFGTSSVDIELMDLYSEKDLSEKDEEFISLLWNAYKGSSGTKLSALTHTKGSPWSQVFNGQHNVDIPNDIIADYYSNLINKNMDEQQQPA
ncbi:Panacea domain-containing protein [Reichenbachiella agariperforans]|uniref:Panacea domain-containing protein n=1 Tax=Reichenbachiella agariperforans TaxID=156994 RepID=UPI001C0885EA|nr:type II toxin-antitoxin system antitoxin SocA domain-containing protein [Reichenbachiella agariperforans]MBU2915864.1 SocA family protein [Reichenbachiella agariperforans]